jgi:predicted secreted protein
LLLLLGRSKVTTEKEHTMTQGIDNIWQVEARNQGTKQLIRDIKRITRRKFTIEEKIRIVMEGFRRLGLTWRLASVYYTQSREEKQRG